MKAEERKENETNALARWIRRHQEKLTGRSLYVVGGIFVLLVAMVVIIWYWRSSTVAANSARIMDFWLADTDKKNEEIITSEKHQGKPTATWAKLQKARLALYRDGMDRIGTTKEADRKAAYAKLEEGKKLYLELVNELKDDPALQQEAWIACARAEEALLGAPREDKAGEFRGDFAAMIEDYQKAAAINSDSDVSKSYAELARTKKAQETELKAFYRRLYELGFTGKIEPPPFDPSQFDPKSDKFKLP